MAADIALAGMDPMRFLESTDHVEIAIMAAITKHWRARRALLDENLATAIINALGRSMK